MKNKITHLFVSSLALAGAVNAGETMMETPPIAPVASSESLSDYFKFSLAATLRYESKIEQAFDHSDALTLRVRPGITILPGKMFSAFVETEHTVAAVDDYTVGSPTLDPFTPGNAAILDPENNELNQAYIQLKNDGFTARLGRQRIILDNAAFIGNVGWRQNEQTYDAISLSYKNADTTLYYAYATQANRIFGTDALGALKVLDGEMHFINGSTKVGEAKVGGYAYLLDFSDGISFPDASSNTYGVQVDYKGFHAEYAYQTDAGDKADYNSGYAHLTYTKKAGSVTYKGGIEYLEEDFVTPLATVHAFNGFADRFIAHRLGLPGTNWEGLVDIYGMASTKVGGVVVKGFVHYFMDDSASDAYGWETDLVLVKKLSDNLTLLGKAAYFVGDDDNIFNRDIIQTSVQLDYKF
ncbi:MAG: alginate export family protein [Akkermansiaceae bacterium]